MKKIYKTLGVLPFAFLMLSLGSCNDQLTTDDAQRVSSETVLSSTTGLNMVLRSGYYGLLLGGSSYYDQVTANYTGMPGLAMHYDVGGSDILCTGNYGGAPDASYKYLQDRTLATGHAHYLWSKMYKIINEVNQILDALPNATGSEEEKNKIEGQALAMRGLSYFNLIVNYQQTYAIAKDKRGVILRTSASDPDEMGFSTVQACYDQIVSDLSGAKAALSGFKRSEKWEIDANVVSGILARVYQVMGNWQNALAEASSVYQNYGTLMTKEEWYGGFDDLVANNCQELVWGVKFTNLSNLSTCTSFNFWYNQDPSYGEGMQDGPIYNFINLLVDQKYVDLFDETDYRGARCDKTAGVTDEDEKAVMFWHRTGNADPEINTKWAYNKIKSYGDGGGAKQSHSYDIDFPLMRGSEMLLIMAEAEANLGNTGQALTYLNTLQAAREAKLTTAADKQTLLNSIYVERRKELLGEGLTGIYDLLRLQQPLVRYGSSASNPGGHFASGLGNLDGYNGSDVEPKGTLPSNDYRFIIQIPHKEFSNNSVISEADQNPFSGQ